MALKLPRFSRSTGAVRGEPDPAAGAAESDLATTLATFAAGQAQAAARRGIEQASLEGAEAGTFGEEPPQASELTAAGRAFNQAAEAAHFAGIKRDVKTRLTEMAIEVQELPPHQWVDAYISSSDGFREGLLAEVDPKMRAATFDYFTELAGNQRLNLLDGQQAELRKQVIADLKVGADQLIDDISTAARELNEPLLTKYQREYEFSMLQAAEAGLMTEDQARAAIQDMHSKAVQNEILGGFDLVLEEDGIEAAGESLDRFKRAKASGMGLSAEEKDALETAMTGEFNRARSFLAATTAQNDAAEKAALAGLRAQSDDAAALLEAGRVPPEDLNALVNDLTAAEEFGRIEDLRAAVSLYGDLVPILNAHPRDQRNALDELSGRQDLTGDDLRTMKALEGIVQRNERLLESDPRSLARSQLNTDDPELNLESPEGLAVSLRARAPFTAAASQHYGMRMPAITDAEAETIGRFWAGQDVPGKLAIAGALSEALGEGAGDVLSLIDSKDYRTLAFAGGLHASGHTDTAAAIMRGEAILGLPDSGQMLPEGVERTALEGHINESLGTSFQFLPETRQTVFDSIMAWYADRQAAQGGVGSEWDRNRADAAIRAVVGNVVEDNTGNLVPLRGGDQDQFQEWLASIDAATITTAGGVMGFEADAAADRVRRSRMIAIAEGRFRVAVPDPFSELPQFLLNEAGEPLELLFDPQSSAPPASFPHRIP